MKAKRLNFLEAHVRRHTFFGPEWADALDRSTMIVHRANGQHSPTMLSRLPEDIFPVGMMAYITHFEIDSVAGDGMDLFDLFDHPMTARDNEDAMGVGKSPYHELDTITRRFLIKIAKGLSAYTHAVNDERHSAFEKLRKKDSDAVRPTSEPVFSSRRLSLYFDDADNRKFALWMNTLSTPLHSKQAVQNEFIFGCAGVVSVMYSDWKHDAPFAATFWKEVLNESNPDIESASRELAVDLRKLNVKDKKTQKDYRKVAAKASRNASLSHHEAGAVKPRTNVAVPDYRDVISHEQAPRVAA